MNIRWRLVVLEMKKSNLKSHYCWTDIKAVPDRRESLVIIDNQEFNDRVTSRLLHAPHVSPSETV